MGDPVTEDIHYLSATAVVTEDGNRHLAFCGERMVWSADAHRYQVANYSDPTRVTCRACLEEWARLYPREAEAFRKHYPRPVPYVPPADEHPDVTEMRECHAVHQKTWLLMWINDHTIPAVDLMAAFTALGYRHARELAALALRLRNQQDHQQ
jgi:hypothetical protein